ncbi:MAG: hypothetical protein C0507_16815, partial [Cyanobacteria bacterium PR.3.49]|nr:hypothetical protein [Cyanobacteria bacterium PR.3.49]
SNNQAIVRVIDTGIGIAPADQQRIFDRFYRVERSRVKSRIYGGGTGLGLAIALTIIKAHGGSIDLESELNKGSTFTVRLPVADEKTGKSDTEKKKTAELARLESQKDQGQKEKDQTIRDREQPKEVRAADSGDAGSRTAAAVQED